MKKLLIFISMLVFLCSCDPERFFLPPYVGIWYVRNDASRNLYILASTVTFKADSVLIKPGDSTFIVKADYPYDKDLKFDQITHTNVTYPSAYVGFYRDPEFKSLIKGWHAGTNDILMVALRRPAMISSLVMVSGSSKYFWSNASS